MYVSLKQVAGTSGVVGEELAQVQGVAVRLRMALQRRPGHRAITPWPASHGRIAVHAAAGEATAKKLCASCHTFNEGGKAGVGPNIYGAVGGDRAASAGFAYSNGLKGKAGKWGYEDLNEWLAKPSAFAPGTRMSFAGIKAADQRANVIAYLRTLSKSPVPLP